MRAFDRRQLIAVRDLDLAGTVREVFESAVRMGIDALSVLGATEKEIIAAEGAYRALDLARLEAQGATGNMHAGPVPIYDIAGKQVRG
jgi:glutathione-regulated potassium-efflux system protein KefB